MLVLLGASQSHPGPQLDQDVVLSLKVSSLLPGTTGKGRSHVGSLLRNIFFLKSDYV